MELSPTWEVASYAATQELLSISWTRSFFTMFIRALH
jgi:hypothetical protein